MAHWVALPSKVCQKVAWLTAQCCRKRGEPVVVPSALVFAHDRLPASERKAGMAPTVKVCRKAAWLPDGWAKTKAWM